MLRLLQRLLLCCCPCMLLSPLVQPPPLPSTVPRTYTAPMPRGTALREGSCSIVALIVAVAPPVPAVLRLWLRLLLYLLLLL